MHLLPLIAAAALASCQVIPSDFLSLEARAIVVDDAEGDISDIGEEDIDLNGYGVHAALKTGFVDFIAGIDQREFDSSETPELDLGLRKRLIGLWKLETYAEANFRYGVDLDSQTKSDDYFGYNAGLGLLIDINGTYFLNVRAVYEFASIDVASGSVDVDGVVGTIGLGIKL